MSGGFIERKQAYRYGGRSRGAATYLKDYSSVLNAEARTYAGLTSTQGGSDGGNMIPIGFIPTVFSAMKRTDRSAGGSQLGHRSHFSDGRPIISQPD